MKRMKDFIPIFSACNGTLTAAAVSEPEANERGSSLIGERSHYRGREHVFAKRKKLW